MANQYTKANSKAVELTKRNLRNKAWSRGRVAGLRLDGIGTNPYQVDMELSDMWEAGYKNGRDEREKR